MSTVLGIDLGTQQLKVIAYDAEARKVCAAAASSLQIDYGSDGSAEQAAQWWVEALLDALSQIDSQVRNSIAAIGVSGQQHGFVPVDKAGDVLAPVKLWCDTSTQTECAEIMSAVGGEQACIAEAGNPILPGYTASKVLWLKKQHPDLYAAMDGILLPHDYLNFYLTGERCMEVGDASGTGFLNVRDRAWSTELLNAIDAERDLGECLPKLRLTNEAIGTLRADVAAQTGLPAGVPVSIGGGDNMMGAIGTGNVAAGRLSISLGTSGTVYAYADQAAVDADGEIAAFCSSNGGWLPLMCTMNCTVSTEFARRLFASDIDAFESHIARAPRGAGGILTLPFFNGERTPNLPDGKACLLGIDTQNGTPENIMRSAMEGATFALKFGVEKLRRLGVTATEIVLTGGGANSPSWRQLVADVCASQVLVLEQNEGAAFGAAMQALELVTDVPLESFVHEHLTENSAEGCEPEPGAVGAYADIYQSYQSAVETIAELYE
ncbi:MAG: xylulokinase [Woeseiaceae bacterium]